MTCNTAYSFYVRSNRQGVRSNNSNPSTAQTLICESSMICSPARAITTNAYDIRRNDSPGSTNQISTYGIISWNESGPKFANLLTVPRDGIITVGFSQLKADLDIFILAGNNGICSASNLITYGNSQASFVGHKGETFYLIFDGYYGAV